MPDPIIAAPTNGNPQQQAAAPVSPQAPAQPSPTQQAAPTPGNTQAPEIKPESIISASQFELSPAERMKQLERDYSASSSEARRQKSRADSLTQTLAEQGLKPVFDSKGNFKGLEPDDKFEGKPPEIDISYKNLPKSIREKLADDPEGAFDDIAARVRETVSRSFARAKPTIEQSAKVEALPPERIDAEVNFLAERKMPDSVVPRYEFNTQSLGVVKSLVQSLSEKNPAFARFLAEDPSTAIQLAADRIAHSMARTSIAVQKAALEADARKSAAAQAAAVAPSAGGKVSVAESGSKSAQQTQYESGYAAIVGKPLTS